MKLYNILVTGCGGDISQSMGKILRSYAKVNKVIGCDIHNDHAGHFIFDECFIVNRASSPLYMKDLVDLVEHQAIDIIIPATEFELEYLLVNNQDKINGRYIIKPDNFSIEIGLDKFKTSKFLEKNNLPFPKTVLLENVKDTSFPCIIKSRRGSGSKTVHIVEDKDTFSLISKLVKDAICQEYLDGVNDEFTCALFRSTSGDIRTLIFRRKLTGGYSGFGVVEKSKVIEELLIKLALALNLRGSINVQLRMHHGIPMIFEINARFSSTVLFRHLLGFEDLIWCIEDQTGLPISSYCEPAEGSKFYKGFQEYIVKV